MVFTLEPSSSDLIEKLIKKRFEGLSAIDAQPLLSFQTEMHDCYYFGRDRCGQRDYCASER